MPQTNMLTVRRLAVFRDIRNTTWGVVTLGAAHSSSLFLVGRAGPNTAFTRLS
jgi:hypothetical protein